MDQWKFGSASCVDVVFRSNQGHREHTENTHRTHREHTEDTQEAHTYTCMEIKQIFSIENTE